jgi:hypothetical protein
MTATNKDLKQWDEGNANKHTISAAEMMVEIRRLGEIKSSYMNQVVVTETRVRSTISSVTTKSKKTPKTTA